MILDASSKASGSFNDSDVLKFEFTSFFERDIDVKSRPINLGNYGHSCSTGDSIVTDHSKINSDLVDMEAYVYAKFSKKFNIKFECYKFISDYADKKTLKNWSTNLDEGAKLFEEKLFQI